MLKLKGILVTGSVFLSVVAFSGCSDSHSATAPTPTSGTPAKPSPTLTRITISGNMSLTSVGDTSQLAVTGTYSDGSTKDVTNQVRWSVSNPNVISISTTGLVTVLNLGGELVYASVLNQFTLAFFKATPPGTFITHGRVREPGLGELMNVRVREMSSGQFVMSSQYGYSMGGLTAGHLRFDLDGYESKEIEAGRDLPAGDDVPMQKVVLVQAGQSVNPAPLAPMDITYDVGSGQRCDLCRLIRVAVPSAGTLHLTVSWATVGSSLGLWVNGQQFVRSDTQATAVNVDVPVTSGESVVYAQRITSTVQHIPFTLSTSLTP